jgi:hypothetical protein
VHCLRFESLIIKEMVQCEVRQNERLVGLGIVCEFD